MGHAPDQPGLSGTALLADQQGERLMSEADMDRINTETMQKIQEAAWKDKRARAWMVEKAGLFHGERAASKRWDKREKEDWTER